MTADIELMAIRDALSKAISSDDSRTFGDLVDVLAAWCHEGCTVDATHVGICSFQIPHDGKVESARTALKVVAAHIIAGIDNGSEGC